MKKGLWTPIDPPAFFYCCTRPLQIQRADHCTEHSVLREIEREKDRIQATKSPHSDVECVAIECVAVPASERYSE